MKPNQRADLCGKKRRHATELDARLAAALLHEAAPATACRGTILVAPFQCEVCGGWHIGKPIGWKGKLKPKTYTGRIRNAML